MISSIDFKRDSASHVAILGETPLSWNDFRDRVGQILNWWVKHPMPKGDVIAIDTSNSLAYTAWMISAMRMGHPVVPLDGLAPAQRMRQLIRQSQATRVVCSRELIDGWQMEGVQMVPITSKKANEPKGIGKFLTRKKASVNGTNDFLDDFPKEIPESRELPSYPKQDAVALIHYTSGSSGNPKGVQLTFGNLETHLSTLVRVYQLDRNSRILNNLALHHADGCVQGPLLALFAGCCWVRPIEKLGLSTVEEFLSAPYRFKTTHVFVVPFFLQMLQGLTHWHDVAFRFPEFKMMISVSAALPAALWMDIERQFGVKLVNVYGLTETVAGSLFAGPEDSTRIPGTIGMPVDCEVRIVDGELWLRGPHISPGYRDSSETLLDEEGWLRTGDLVQLDPEHGCFVIHGRLKNACNIAGYLVRPEEISEALQAIEGVSDAICFGRSDELTEERLLAAVVLEAGHPLSQLPMEELQSELANQLRSAIEEYKIPSEVQVWNELPRGASGKVQIPAVRSLWAALAEGSRVDATRPRDIEATVLQCARKAFRTNEVNLKSASTHTPGWDSMAHMDLILLVEQKFQIRFTVAETMRANSMHTLLNIVREKI